MGIDCGLAFHQFGKVVGIHLGLVVLQRVSLREKERFGSLAVTVDGIWLPVLDWMNPLGSGNT